MFVHLHNHTRGSVLDAMPGPEEYAKAAKSMGHPAVAITDHGNLYMAYKFWQACKKEGVKPILGQEFYMARGDNLAAKDDRRQYHLTVLAKNTVGWHNLIRLSSLAFLEGFHYRPRIDKKVLAKHREGLIVLSGCLRSELANAWFDDNSGRMRGIVQGYQDIFGEDYYLEIEPEDTDNQIGFNTSLVDLARSEGVPLVATNDCHYMVPEDHKYHSILLLIQTKQTVNIPTPRMRFQTPIRYYCPREDMLKWFSRHYINMDIIKGAMDQTLAIAKKVEDFEFDTSIKIPKFREVEDAIHSRS